MKKVISILIILTAYMAPSFSAFAESNSNTEDNYILSNAYFESLGQADTTYDLSAKSSKLITQYNLSVAKSGSDLILNAETQCTADVVKCGFTYIIIQQYKNEKWVDYKTFNDLYSNSNKYTVTKSITVAKGFKYRAIAQHYAKKSLLSTEKIKSTTSSLSL